MQSANCDSHWVTGVVAIACQLECLLCHSAAGTAWSSVVIVHAFAFAELKLVIWASAKAA